MQHSADIIVIGAGIAGASAAAELAASASLLLLEMEAQPGYHATGRSAAFFAPAYGNKVVRGITAASEQFFRSPPAGFSDVELFRARDCLFIARQDQRQQLAEMQADNDLLEFINTGQVCQQVPVLKREKLYGGMLDSSGGDLDVDAILQAYLRMYRKRGGQIVKGQAVQTLKFEQGCWHVGTSSSHYSAPVIVNAAGAWADNIAALAGIPALGIVPKRRTAILIDPPDDMNIDDWPLTIDADEQFYFKPDAGQLLLSPADETPSLPCDAQADELDVAIAVDRFEKATDMDVKRVNHRWAGLRSFARDKTFVVGFDPRQQGFFWLAGQGGYGVQSAPGLSWLARHLLLDVELPEMEAAVLDYKNEVAPDRLIQSN